METFFLDSNVISRLRIQISGVGDDSNLKRYEEEKREEVRERREYKKKKKKNERERERERYIF